MKDRNSTLVLFLFFASAIGFLCLMASACGLVGTLQLAVEGVADGLSAMNLIVVGTIWCAILLMPGAWLTLRRLQKGAETTEAPQPSHRFGKLIYLAALLVYPVLLILGTKVAARPGLSPWVLPFVHILAASIPVYALSGMATHRLDSGSSLRRWSAFGMGLVLGPGLILIFELALIAILAIGLIIQIGSDPVQATDLVLLAERLQYAQADPETILSIIQPYLFQPLVLFGIAAFVAGLVPLIEESLKPIGVWLLVNRRLAPAEGFAMGVFSGAGYALFENLFITAPGSEWALISVGRIGTTAMHMFTAGITGFALVSAWQHNRFWRLGILFAGAVLIHVAWNALTLLSLTSALPASIESFQWIRALGQASTGSLALLFLFTLIGLLFANWQLRKPGWLKHAIIAAPVEPAPPEIEIQEATLEESVDPGADRAL
jgi:hypothetical protein